MSGDPSSHVFWLASRALGIVALVLMGASVALGLALSGRAYRRPGGPAWLKHLHEATGLTGLIAIAAHGAVLLGDDYLRPGVAGVLLPFQMSAHPAATGIGIIAGWLAAILGLSFYLRRSIGTAVWRWLHRWTLGVYLLSVVHAIAAGSDARSGWMLAIVAISAAPAVFALTYRVLPREPVRVA